MCRPPIPNCGCRSGRSRMIGIVGAFGGDGEAEGFDEEVACLGDIADSEADMVRALGQGSGHFSSFSARSAAISARSWLISAAIGRTAAEISASVKRGVMCCEQFHSQPITLMKKARSGAAR